nr:minor capsid protein [uncultured Anaerostipes sp.]DAQ13423.1 MAG TPA: Minor capsid protein from bacteriophage [Caudoviricetes sp.]
MLLLADIKDWLKIINNAEHYYTGKLDNKKLKSIGVYQQASYNPKRYSIGGNKKYEVKNVSLLIHWNENARETEIAAIELFERLETQKQFKINDTKVYFLSMQVSEPVDVGTDDNGIYERVINLDLYYER